MKTITAVLIAGCLISNVQAQTAANYTFAGSSSAPSSTGQNLNASSVSMGSDIGSQAFSGSDFYGQDGWPATATPDVNAYMQLTLTPNSGYYLALTKITLDLRHSTLGTAAGSGPTSWSLVSSLDGYTTTLASGTLTTSYQSFAVILPAAFQSIFGAVTFRIYGYNEMMTSGGSNRLVTNSIKIAGQATPGTLAAVSIDLTAKAAGPDVELQWQTQGISAGDELLLQRSTDGVNFNSVSRLTGNSAVDNPSVTGQLYYRIAAQTTQGDTWYSPVATVMISGTPGSTAIIRGVAAAGGSLRTFLSIAGAGNYLLQVLSEDGKTVYQQQVHAQAGQMTVDMAFTGYAHGIYILTLAGTTGRNSREFIY